MNTNKPSSSDAPPPPWWQVGMVWLVLGGPAAVVVAGIVTAVIAVRGAEPVLTSHESAKFSDRPAVQGRNHAATAQPAP
jgi:hypothetical protein